MFSQDPQLERFNGDGAMNQTMIAEMPLSQGA